MITFVLIFIKAYSEQKHDIEIKYYRPDPPSFSANGFFF